MDAAPKPKSWRAATGQILAVRGPVIDVAFPPGELPGLYEVLSVAEGRRPVLLEVQRLLGAKTVRTIALWDTPTAWLAAWRFGGRGEASKSQ